MRKYKGPGEHSVKQLEEIIAEREERLHNMQISLQTLIDSSLIKGTVKVFNSRKWLKAGGDTKTNEEFWEEAEIINLRVKGGELFVDVRFNDGVESKGHFFYAVKEAQEDLFYVRSTTCGTAVTKAGLSYEEACKEKDRQKKEAKALGFDHLKFELVKVN